MMAARNLRGQRLRATSAAEARSRAALLVCVEDAPEPTDCSLGHTRRTVLVTTTPCLSCVCRVKSCTEENLASSPCGGQGWAHFRRPPQQWSLCCRNMTPAPQTQPTHVTSQLCGMSLCSFIQQGSAHLETVRAVTGLPTGACRVHIHQHKAGRGKGEWTLTTSSKRDGLKNGGRNKL